MSIRSTFASFTLLAAALLVSSGCKSTDHHDHGASAAAAAASPAPGPAIYCDKCQTTFTKTPLAASNPRGPYGVVGYRTVSKHECDECRNVAVGIIQQGKTTTPGETVHKCKICGGSMTVCHTS